MASFSFAGAWSCRTRFGQNSCFAHLKNFMAKSLEKIWFKKLMSVFKLGIMILGMKCGFFFRN